MLLFLSSLVCSLAVLIASMPPALNRANRIHIENGRHPNAGIAFMPDLIAFMVVWWGGGFGLKYFFSLRVALVVIYSITFLLLIVLTLIARKSNREYTDFVNKDSDHSEKK